MVLAKIHEMRHEQFIAQHYSAGKQTKPTWKSFFIVLPKNNEIWYNILLHTNRGDKISLGICNLSGDAGAVNVLREEMAQKMVLGQLHISTCTCFCSTHRHRLVFAPLIIHNLSQALYGSVLRAPDDISWLITCAQFPIINIFYSWKILCKSLPLQCLHWYRFACGPNLKLSIAAYLCIINLMNKMFLKAISAHIRGLIKPNRVELWLILSLQN